jgi:protein-disulfide isomerase
MEENNLKVTLGVIGISLVLVGAVVALVQLTQRPIQEEISKLEGNSVHILGNKDAEISVVEFSDFQCPACKVAAPELKRFMSDYKDQVKFVFRHFGLPQHQNALLASYAAEAGEKQNKFWEVHDWLFANQSSWQSATVSGEYFYGEFGDELGLNKDKFLEDYKSNDVRDRVAADNSLAKELRLSSTPSIFINGVLYSSVLDYDQLVQLSGVTVVNTGTPTSSISPTPEPT